VAKSTSQRDDDVVVQSADYKVVLPVDHTCSACAGAAAAFLLRRIAYRAGAYAPGIQEHMFFELTTDYAGGSLDAVQRWFGSRVGDLHYLGYRVLSRRVSEQTPTIVDWVKEGRGYRGAVLPTSYERIHPGASTAERDYPHAVGVTFDKLDGGAEDMMMVDPWPGVGNGAKDRAPLPANLEGAHRPHRYNALILYWSGWS
jgi:hypothetical protein